MVVSYDKLVVRLPACGDWSKESRHNLFNTVPSNYGCSVQRAVGLMVADPGDLIGPRPIGPQDAQRSSTILQLYRAGEVTGAARAAEEAAQVAGEETE